MHTPTAPGRAALPLRLPDGMQDALAHAFQIAVGAAQMIQSAGHGILNVLVLAAAALEDQLHFDLVVFPLLEMDDRGFLAQVVAAVLAGERIHGIGTQLAEPRGFRDGFQDRFLDADLVHAHGGVNDERGHPVSWQIGPESSAGHIHVGQNDVERLRRLRAGRFVIGRDGHRGAHVRRKICGRLRDQFQQAAGKEFHFTTSQIVILHSSSVEWDEDSIAIVLCRLGTVLRSDYKLRSEARAGKACRAPAEQPENH
jgi:hypothetical protein